jgi:CRP/FNR family cyclic AMP-dependent transcriptional regulator
MEDITLKEVPARLASLASLILFLVESEGVQVPGEIRIPTRYTHERLGTMIRANRTAVTRAFGLLQDDGVVHLKRRLIYVTDIEPLKRSAAYGEAYEEQRGP